MELKTLTRDMAAIEDGRWVDRSDVPGMGDMSLKVRGSSTDAFRRIRDERIRGGMEAGAATVFAVNAYCLIDVKGLTNGDNPISVEQLRDLLSSDETGRFDPLGLIVLDAVKRVDESREAKEIAFSKN